MRLARPTFHRTPQSTGYRIRSNYLGPLARRLDVGAMVEQHLDDLQMAAGCSEYERREA